MPLGHGVKEQEGGDGAQLCGFYILGVKILAVALAHVVHNTDFCIGPQISQQPHSLKMGKDHVMGRLEGQRFVLDVGEQTASMIGSEHREHGLVDGAPVFDPITEFPEADLRIPGVPGDELRVCDAAGFCHPQGKVGVEQIHKGSNAVCDHAVNETVVVVNGLLIGLGILGGDNAAPCDGETEHLDSKLTHHFQIHNLSSRLQLSLHNHLLR